MRSLLFDELRNSEIEAVFDYLEREADPSGLEGLYWIPLPKSLWNEIQLRGLKEEELEESGFKLSAEVGPGWVRFELLVRSGSLINTGGGPADERQVMFILNWADKMAGELKLHSCLPLVNSDQSRPLS